MAEYQSAAELQRQRKAALRAVRRAERASDTALERIERRIFVLLARKNLITQESAQSFVQLWNYYMTQTYKFEQALADFLSITSI